VVTPLAATAHPLMTFSNELYDHETYRRIPFVCGRGGVGFAALFPELPNPSFVIDPRDMPRYHALCTMAGNFTTLLWAKAFEDFEGRLRLPRETLYPYLERVAANLAASSAPLTGPLARGDLATVGRHLEALDGDPYGEVYRAFVAAHGTEPRGNGS
jgi:predicted short-subunit dehydrogenase-like oxidoreductase (DUF2520 family)